MKYVSIREFRSKCSKYMGELPFVLTSYGRPTALVSKYEKVVSKEKSGIQNVVSNPKTVSKKDTFQNLKELHSVPKPAGKPKKKKWAPWKQDKSLGICVVQNCQKPAVEEVTSATNEGEDVKKKVCKFHAAAAKKERGYS